MLDRQLSLGRSREGRKLTAAQFLRQLSGSAGGPIPVLLQPQVRDSLHLTKEQTDSLSAIQARHVAAVNDIFQPVADYLAALDDDYDAGKAMARVRAARERSLELTLDVTRAAREVLTAEQLRQLPSFVQVMFDEQLMRRVRRAGGDSRGVRF